MPPHITFLQIKMKVAIDTVSTNTILPQCLILATNLAVVSFGANLSSHVLLVKRRGDAKTVAHAEYLNSSLGVADLHSSIQDDIPVIELQTRSE